MNGTRVARRVLIRATAMAVGLLAGVMAAVAFGATTPSLGTTVNSPLPEQGISTSVTFSGTSADGNDSVIDAVARPAGGVACQATFSADQEAASSASQVIANKVPVDAGVFYSVTQPWTPNATGSVMVCAWLEQPGSGSSVPITTGPDTTMVTVSGPQGSTVSATTLPSTPTAGQAFSVQYATQTDQPLSLYSVVRQVATGACAASFQADRQQFPNGTQLVQGKSVGPGSTTTSAPAKLAAGSYVVCAWVQGPTPGEIDATASTPFAIAAPTPKPTPKPKPTPAPAKASPAIAITSLTASTTKGITVAGTTAASFAGTLMVKATCNKASVTGAASASDGAFRASLALPAGCAAGSQVTVKVQWPGSTTFKKDIARNSTVVPAATTHSSPPTRHHTQTDKKTVRTLFTQVHREKHSLTNLFRTRPRRILVASSTHLVLRLRWTHWDAKGGRGQGTADTRHHGHYRVSVAASHDIKGTFACLTVSHRVHGHRHILRLGLGREGHALLWVPLKKLHSRHFKGRPWPLHGCPAVKAKPKT